MNEKLTEILKKYNALTKELSIPEIIADQKKFAELSKAHAEIQPLAERISHLNEVLKNIEEAQELLKKEKDQEMIDYLKGEIESGKEKVEKLEIKIKELMIEKDPNDEKNIIMEIRAGAGGEEAGLFAADLFRMYIKFAEASNFKVEVMNTSPSDIGGFKEIIFEVNGKGAFSKFKYESGVHRVQRVPATESSGRIHTSTATVAVLPEAEEVEVEIDHNDLRIDIFRSSGPGGQSVNTTDSAVRITHLPSSIVVQCQDEKSQLQNKERAMRILRARLYEIKIKEQHDEMAQTRRSQVGTGDRSERIRTYNYPQGRVTDHRINFTVHNLDEIMEGKIDEIVEALTAADRAEKLEQVV